MPRPLCCRFCRSELDPAQEFAYHVESLTAADPGPLGAVRRLPHASGRPVRVCRPCQERGEHRRPRSPSAVTAVAALGLVAVTATLGRWLMGRVA